MGSVTESLVGPVIERSENLILDYTISGIKYITQYKKLRKDAKTLMEQLRKRRDEVVKEVEKRGVREGKKITSDAETWLNRVNELIQDKKLIEITELREEIRQGNPCDRYTWGKIASEGCANIKIQLADVPSNERLTRDVSGEEVKNIIEGKIASPWKSRNDLMNNLIDKLLDREVKLVGLYGPMGVGKTVMLRDIKRDKKVKKAFNKIVIVKVGSNPDLREIQDKIAKELDLQLKDDGKTEERAYDLYAKISSQREKLLIMLDDVCEKLDIKLLGTDNDDLCKHLVVSDSVKVCDIMGLEKKCTLEMVLMSAKEAESFFWKKVYDLKRGNNKADQVTTYAYIYVAQKLINTYCNRSTNVIMSLAKLLGNKELTLWKELEDELKRRQDSSPDKIIVQKSTKTLSENKEFEPAKELFALACVFPKESSIPIIELMRCAIGLELIKDVDDLSDAMSIAQKWVQELVSVSWQEEDDEENQWSGGLGYVSVSNHDAYNAVIEEREKTVKNTIS